MSLAETPRKSSCLVIFNPIPRENRLNQSDYEVLLLKRKGTMSFGNALAFPGGVLETNDARLLQYIPENQRPKTSFEEERFLIARITALRETFEETGLFFLNPKLFGSNKTKILEIFLKLHQENKLHFDLIVEFFGLPLAQLTPLGRLITIQSLPKRYDTVFFGAFMNNDDLLTINVGEFQTSPNKESLFELKKMKINLSESDFFRWLTPKEGLDGYFNGQIHLAPPQIFQFAHFSGLPELKLLEKFHKIGIIEDSQSTNELKKRPFYFPTILYMKKIATPNFYWIFPGDHEYPIEKIVGKEESEELKQELLEKYKTLKWEKPQTVRVLSAMDKKRPKLLGFFGDKNFKTMLDGITNIKFSTSQKPKL